eukprot:Em0014g526a
MGHFSILSHQGRHAILGKISIDSTILERERTKKVFVFLHNPAVGRGFSKKFHKPWQGPFKFVDMQGPYVYRIADCANPKRQKVMHFNRLKPAPKRLKHHHLRREQNVMEDTPPDPIQLVITMKIFYLPLYQWNLRIDDLNPRIDSLSLGQLQMFQGQDVQPESGMVEPMDMGHSADSSELISQIQTVRMSLRPPSRFTGGTDLILWLKRFELVISQQGLVDSSDDAAVTRCLRAQYAPEGNHLEWQAKFQRRGQKADENLVTYVGELRILADKAYPGWSNDQRLQLVRDQFVQGAAQKTLSSERGHGSSSLASSSIEDAVAENGIATMSVQQLRKQAQDSERIVQDLRKQIQELNGRLSGKEKPTVADQPPQSSAFSRQQGSAAITCWNCREQGHVRRNCPHKRNGRKKGPWQISAVSQNAGRCTSNSSALLVEPVWRFTDQHGLMVAHSVISDAAATHTMVQVLNPGFAPVTVYKDEIMFQDVIALDDSDLGRTRLTSHQINTGDTQPVRQQARRLPFHQQQEVRGLLDDMLSQGIIEPSCGPWASSIVLAKKKDGTTRFCVDFRHLNDCTRKDAQPLPRIDDTLDALGGAQYFSTLDLASGYWQVEVDSRDREKTAFVTPFGQFQFRVMPFDLCNAPATFQRLMERVLAGLHWMTCLVYLDDIIIFSRSVKTHVEQLKEVLERLKIAGLKIRTKKCHLLQTSVQYLGHVISAEGIRTDPQKVACVSNWPVPRSSKELQSFLGLASYYRRFVKVIAHIASPLHALTEKGREWVWSKECNDAFFDLKKRLVSSPILTLPDFSLPFVLDTDASGDGLGAVLAQNVDGVERVVAYASRALSRTEKKYCATRQEMLALCGLEEKEEEREEANSCDAVSHLMLPTWTEEEIKSFQSADPDIHWLETDATPRGCPKDASWRLASLKSPSHKARAPMEISQTLRPMQRVAMDILGPLPETLRDSLHTDQGRNFEAKVLKEVCQLLGVKKTRTTPYHPQSDGLVESRHVTTGVTPFELMYGHDARLPEDVLFSIPATAEDPIQYADVLKNQLQLAYKRVNQHMAVQQGHQKESTAEEEDEYYDVIVHSVPPADTDRQATILEVPRQHQLEHPAPEIEQPAVVPRVPPPAVEGAPALRRSNRISRPPVRYGDPVVLPDTLDTPEIFE